MVSANQLGRLIAFIILICCLSSLWAQELPFTSGPTRIYSFSTAPTANSFFNGTQFGWAQSRGDHSGLAYLDGVNDSVNLWSYPDDNGLYFPSNIGQRSFSICVWAQFLEIQTYSRLFETSAIYGAGDNIALIAVGNTGTFGYRVYSGATRYGNDIPRAIWPNSWQYICLVGDQISLTDATSNTAANYTTYINAAPVGTFVGPLPRDVYRGIANIGKSSFLTSTDNLYFRGWIDGLYWYNYQLQDQQIAAHFVCKRPPIFDIAFAENPSQISGISNPTYGFILSDPEDSSIANYRKGLLTFDGSTQFVNLATDSGSNSVGTKVPILGGNGFGTDFNFTWNGFMVGWTFECLVKFTQITDGSRVYSFSDGGTNDIFLGFSGTSNTLIFSVATNSMPTTITVRDNTPLNTWMHIVVTITRSTATNFYFNVFLDGQFVRSASGAWPAAVTRSTAYLARGSSAYLGMKLDSMRIFDFALSNSTVTALYTTTNSPLPTPTNNATREDMYSTSPVVVYGFDNPNLVSVTNFNWTEQIGPYTGVAVFGGNPRNFVDLSSFPDDYGKFLPLVFGGEMTFEMRVAAYSLNSWARVFDLGGRAGREDDNIFFAIFETSADMVLSVWSGNAASGRGYVRSGWKVGQFQHIALTITQIDFSNRYSSTAAQYSMYVDGILRSQTLGYLPNAVARPSTFLARSNWQDNARFRGAIDYFSYYQYPLSSDQVYAHACVGEAPIFETAFNSDPRVLMSGSTTGYTYNFLAVDDILTPPGLYQHRGILSFSSASSQFVDLNTYQYPNGMGTILPIIGGNGAGIGSTLGFTFETQVLFRSSSTGSVFDFGSGTSGLIHRIRLGVFSGSSALKFIVTNSAGSESGIDILNIIAPNIWYHILIVVTPTSEPIGTTATYSVYVNGISVASSTTGYYPLAVNRTRAYIGRSQDGVYSNIYLDVLRIYNYAVTDDMARCVYQAANNVPPTVMEAAVYSTRPVYLWGFESPWPDTIQALYEHHGDVDGRYGVAYFNGLTSFANLGTFSDSYGLTASVNVGGELSFQTWLRFSSLSDSMRIFDFSNGADANSFNLMVNNGNGLLFTIYGSDNTQITTLSVQNAISAVNVWFHLCITIAQVSRSDSTSLQAALVTVYINGESRGSQRMKLPQVVERNSIFLGRGVATTSVRFNGYIDSFAMFDYPIQPESLKVHVVSARLPIFELDFARDPRDFVNFTSATPKYSWIANTLQEGPTGLHKGLLVLNKGLIEYVDLRQSRGPYSIGVILPEIGGRFGFGQALDWSSGLSIQITFNMNTKTEAALFTTGNFGSQYEDHIRLLVRNGGLVVESTRSRGLLSSTLTIISDVQAGKWYHVVVIMAPSNFQLTQSTWTAFVNGHKVVSVVDMIYPAKITREFARLGGNTTADAFDGYIDSFRIFDHLLSVASLQDMYALSTDSFDLGQINLGCGQYYRPSPGSILISFILKRDIATFDNTFGAKIERALTTGLGLRFGMVGCHSAVGTQGRVSLAVAPKDGETQVRVYFYNFTNGVGGGNTVNDATTALALFQSVTTQNAVNQALIAEGLPIADYTSISRVEECGDGSVQDKCPSSSSSSLSSGAIAGIVIGVIIGCIILILLGIVFLRHRSSADKSFDNAPKKEEKWESQTDEDTSETAEEGIEMN